MIAAAVLLLMLGSQRSVLGALVGGFVGTVAAAGLVEATKHGELARLHTPVGLVADLLPLAAVVLVLALVGSYAVFAAAVAWTVGAVAAAITANPGRPGHLRGTSRPQRAGRQRHRLHRRPAHRETCAVVTAPAARPACRMSWWLSAARTSRRARVAGSAAPRSASSSPRPSHHSASGVGVSSLPLR